jgi:hypothetical protein
MKHTASKISLHNHLFKNLKIQDLLKLLRESIVLCKKLVDLITQLVTEIHFCGPGSLLLEYIRPITRQNSESQNGFD